MASKVIRYDQASSAARCHNIGCYTAKRVRLKMITGHLACGGYEGTNCAVFARFGVCRGGPHAGFVPGKHKPTPMLAICNEKTRAFYNPGSERLSHHVTCFGDVIVDASNAETAGKFQ